MGWRVGAGWSQPGGWLEWWFSLERKLSHDLALSGQHRSQLIREALEAHWRGSIPIKGLKWDRFV